MAATALTGAAVAFVTASPRDAIAQCAVALGSVNCAVSTATTDTTKTNAATANSSDRSQDFSIGGSITGAIQNGVTISGAGLAIGTSQNGANVSFTNSGSVNISSAPTQGGTSAVQLRANTGAVTYSGSGSIESTAADGLFLQNHPASTSDVLATIGGNVSGLQNGISAYAGSGNVQVNITNGTILANNVAVTAQNDDLGTVTVNMTGGQIGTAANRPGTGISAISPGNNLGGGNVNVTAGTMFTNGEAISASVWYGFGTVSVTANGAIDSGSGPVISAGADAGTTTINVNAAITNNAAASIIQASSGGGGFIINNNAAGIIKTSVSNAEVSLAILIQNNAGGNITLNNAGALWGAIFFSQGANTVSNSGTWNVGYVGNFGTGSTAVTNTGTINVIGSGGMTGSGVTLTNTTGTIALATPSSTLSVTGGLTLQNGGTYRVNVNPTTSSVTNVTGTASLGGTVNAVFAAGGYVAKQYTILTTTGGRTGMFSGLTTTSAPAGFASSLSYSANNAYLDLALGAGAGPIGLPPNQQAAGQSIAAYFNNGGTLPPGFVTLAGSGNPSNAYGQVSGEGSASGPASTAYASSNTFINAVIDPSIDGRAEGAVTSFADETMAYASSRKMSREAREAYTAVTTRDKKPDPFAVRWSVWASGYGGTSSVSGDTAQGTSNTSSRVYGTVVGADYRIGRDTLLGFALGGAGTSFSSGALGSGRADLLQFGVYGRHNFGAAYVSGALSYGWQDVTTTRTVTVAGTDTLEGRFKTNTFSARGEIGYRYGMSFVGITPYGALQFTNVRLPAYAERATSGSNQFALAFASQASSNVRSELGLRADKPFLMAEGLLTLRGRAAWAHDSNTNRAISPTFQSLPGSASFTVNGAQPSANAALLTAGAEMKWRNGWALAATYEAEFSRTTASNAGKGTARYAW